jgi:hypothetical protein
LAEVSTEETALTARTDKRLDREIAGAAFGADGAVFALRLLTRSNVCVHDVAARMGDERFGRSAGPADLFGVLGENRALWPSSPLFPS